MAINISDHFLEANTARQFGLKTLIRLAPVRRKLNPALRAVLPKRARALESPCIVTDAFDAAAAHYQEHRWAFVENIFADDFHAALARNYPPRRFLQPVAGLTKSYDRVSITDRNRDIFAPFPELLALSDYLQAPAFESRVSRIGGQDGFRTSGHLHLTRSWPGTFMIPHQDSALESDGIAAHINAIFFVAGSGGDNSGGLTLARDNELRSVIFAPRNLTNTCLIYDIREPFFHGFNPIASGKYRHAVIMNWQLKRETT
jgi:hypothetical protein